MTHTQEEKPTLQQLDSTPSVPSKKEDELESPPWEEVFDNKFCYLKIDPDLYMGYKSRGIDTFIPAESVKAFIRTLLAQQRERDVKVVSELSESWQVYEAMAYEVNNNIGGDAIHDLRKELQQAIQAIREEGK